MKTFYKIENNGLQTGSGDFIPDGFIEYTVGEEPTELIDALTIEAEKQSLSLKLSEAKAYLSSTDYIVTKLSEYQALGESTAELLVQYADVLTQRKEARMFIGANQW